MDKEEFLNFLNESTKSFKEFFDAKRDFESDLSEQLCEFIYKDHKEIQENLVLTEQLEEVAKTCAMMAYECYNKALERQESGKPYKQKFYAPSVKI